MWEDLSPEGAWILLRIEWPISIYGLSPRELAAQNGWTTRAIRRARDELRDELERLPG